MSNSRITVGLLCLATGYSMVAGLSILIPPPITPSSLSIAILWEAVEELISIKGTPLALDDLIYYHLLPDKNHLDFKQQDSYCRRQETVMGCTTVIDGNKSVGPKAIRTVDWFPMDVYGKYAFLELRETPSGIRTVNRPSRIRGIFDGYDAFDNGYAGDRPLMQTPCMKWLKRI